ncbi:MAG TPA: hypothetical protein VML55_05385 [Planctomycetaceae bacterium]|nr:hypothetical protein [Planctomycetaceae bacterium]
MAREERKRLFVDPTVQGAIVRRAALYWGACLMFVCLPLIIGRTLTDPSRLFYEHLGDLWAQSWPLLTCAVLILPVILYDLAKLTNRFAGPVVRLRRALKQLADGRPVEPVRFREGDFWPELAAEFNRAAGHLEQQAGGSAEADDAFHHEREPEPVCRA